MAAAQTTTVSTCIPDTARGKHVFHITGYSLHKGSGMGKFIRSAKFAVGGYDWCLRYYPDGENIADRNDHVSVYLEIMSASAATGVRASFDLRLVDQTTGLSSSIFSMMDRPTVFSIADCTGFVHNLNLGASKFMKRSDLEGSAYLRDDRLVIECDLIVIKKPLVVDTAITPKIQLPPSDLLDNLAELLEGKKGADVSFEVQGEVVSAHKAILAMRSQVFDAELYGPMGENKQYITVEDMQPVVFKVLLHFIYTDSLPAMDDLDSDDNKEMIKHLLVAADRYAMERLKIICEGILCDSLDVETVATTLALADQHHCSKLKDACVEFLNSQNRMDDVVANQGYQHLKRASPAVLIDMWEKAAKARKI